MIYYFRDHLGKGTAPLADIAEAVGNGTLSGQTLVSLNGETWQSVEAAQKPPALPAHPPVQYIQVQPAKKKKSGCLAWGLVMLSAILMFAFITQKTSKPSANDAKDQFASAVLPAITATSLRNAEQRQYIITPENDHFELIYRDHRAASMDMIAQAERDLKNASEIEMIPSKVSRGGFLLVTVKGSTIRSVRPEDTTVVVVDKSGREITRSLGDRRMPDSLSGDKWWSVFAVHLPELIDSEIRVRVSNSVSQRYADFIIRPEKKTEKSN